MIDFSGWPAAISFASGVLRRLDWAGVSNILVLAASLVNSRSTEALPPPASTWQWAQLACRYDRARALRDCAVSAGSARCGSSGAGWVSRVGLGGPRGPGVVGSAPAGCAGPA